MTEQSVDTSRSSAESSVPKPPSQKDKNCPFCHQAFTSSSLGRHLDLYIKTKNPKPPDGVHIVDEIRRLRQGITRRQARTSSVKKESSGPTPAAAPSSAPPVLEQPQASPVVVHTPPVNGIVGQKVRVQLNHANWQATGVINNLPPRPTSSTAPVLRREVSRHEQQKTDYEQRQKATEEWEAMKAAQLALQEVLNSVREASGRATSGGLFSFDPYTMSFPSLCLHILPSPSTLFSPTPFPTSESWSINPPNQKQFDALNRTVHERLLVFQRQRQQQQFSSPSTNGTNSSSSLPTPPLYDPDPQKLFAHLADAWSHWKSLPDQQKYDAWQLEILRSYSRAEELRKRAESDLEAAKREIEQLRSARCSGTWPVAAPAPTENPLHVPTDTMKQLGRHGLDVSNWDYDRLIEKWRNVVRDNRKTSNGMSAQRALCSPSGPQTGTSSSSANCMNGHQFYTVNGNGGNCPSGNAKTGNPIFSAPSTRTNSLQSADNSVEGDDDASDDDADADVDAEDATPGATVHINGPQHQQPPHSQAGHAQHHPPQPQHQQQQTPAAASSVWARHAQNINQPHPQNHNHSNHHMQHSQHQHPHPHPQHPQHPPLLQHAHSHAHHLPQHYNPHTARHPPLMLSPTKMDHAGSGVSGVGGVGGVSGVSGVGIGGVMPMDGIEGSADGFLQYGI